MNGNCTENLAVTILPCFFEGVFGYETKDKLMELKIISEEERLNGALLGLTRLLSESRAVLK